MVTRQPCRQKQQGSRLLSSVLNECRDRTLNRPLAHISSCKPSRWSIVRSEPYTRWSILKFFDTRRRPQGWRRFLAGRGGRCPPGRFSSNNQRAHHAGRILIGKGMCRSTRIRFFGCPAISDWTDSTALLDRDEILTTEPSV